MSVSSLDSVHAVCRFTFSYPAMNFSFCRFTHHPSHTTLPHIIFHTQLCHTLSFTNNFQTHTQSFTHNLVTHAHTIFLCHAPSFTHNLVNHTHTHHLSLSHTIFHIQLCHTQLCFTSRSSTTSFLFPSFPVPATTFLAHYWEKLTCGVIRSFNGSFYRKSLPILLTHILPGFGCTTMFSIDNKTPRLVSFTPLV